jgi:hypothetical protein
MRRRAWQGSHSPGPSRPLLAGLAGLLLAMPAGAAELRLRLTPEYSSGRYGADTRTTTLNVPMDIGLASGRGSATVRLPWLAVSGPADFVPRLGALGAEGGTRRGTQTGLGDVRFTLAYTLVEEDEEVGVPHLGIALQTRFPTATRASLSSGQVEHLLRLDTGFSLGGFDLDVSVGRRFVAFPRRGREETDYWTLFGILGRDVGSGWTVGVAVDAQDRVPDAARPVLEVGAFVERAVTPDLTVGVFAWKGLTSESASFSLGLRFAYRTSLWADRIGR